MVYSLVIIACTEYIQHSFERGSISQQPSNEALAKFLMVKNEREIVNKKMIFFR